MIEEGRVSPGTWRTATHDFDDPSHPLVTSPIRIGEGAWVAGEVLWGLGFKWVPTVASVAVLVKDIQDDEVVGGNPAQVLRKRGHS